MKSTVFFKARDKLTKKRHTNKLKKLSKNDNKEGAESDASTDDLPLIALKNETPEKGTVHFKYSNIIMTLRGLINLKDLTN